ncbi:hypothetical protein QBC45DRAFT_452117 [Copromyces sp. CBS 386.78]|nr:hypothetical protein QBC45DRAFT_452117 [Copromyces sp. CBS 386.78]
MPLQSGGGRQAVERQLNMACAGRLLFARKGERAGGGRGCDGDDGDDNRHGITPDRLQAGREGGGSGRSWVVCVHSQPATGALSGGGGRATSNVSGKLGETVGKGRSKSVESQPGNSVK